MVLNHLDGGICLPAAGAHGTIGGERFIMLEQEDEIVRLEEQFPALAGAAFAAARAAALAAGQSVLQSEEGAIYEIFPDGSRKRVKDIEPPTRVVRGARITIR